MDAITGFAAGIRLPLLTEISNLIDNPFIFTGLIIAIVLVAEQRNGKRVKMAIALLAAVVAGLALKEMYGVARLCGGSAGCPEGYAFPSIHSIAAFTLMIAFLNNANYSVFLLFALFVAFTRLHLAVHAVEDVIAALPVSLLAYHIVDCCAAKLKIFAGEHE